MGTDVSSDPFADSGGDPFAETPPEPSPPASAIDPPDEDGAQGVAPVVDREGRHIDPQTGEVIEAPAEAPEPQPVPEPQGQSDEAAAEAATEPQEAPAPAEAPVEPQEAPQAPPAPAEAPAAADASLDGAEAAPTADEGKSPWRHYMLLYQTGPSGWTEYDLSTVPADLKQYVERLPLDDKKPQGDSALFMRARNADHARRLAWIFTGRPDEGVTVNPVARSSWKPKRLSKAPPAPERERLVIS